MNGQNFGFGSGQLDTNNSSAVVSAEGAGASPELKPRDLKPTKFAFASLLDAMLI